MYNKAKEAWEKDEVKQALVDPKSASPPSPSRPAWPLFKPSWLSLSLVSPTLHSQSIFFQVHRSRTLVEPRKISSIKIHSNNFQKFTTNHSLFSSSIYCFSTGKKPGVVCFVFVRQGIMKSGLLNLIIGRRRTQSLTSDAPSGVTVKHGGRPPRAKERHFAPWWDERSAKLFHEVHPTSWT